MLGHAGFLTSLKKSALSGMIEVVKGVEPETGYGSILQVSEAESAMRDHRIRKTKTVCTYCGVGVQFRCLDERPSHSQSGAGKGPSQWDFHLREGKVWLGSHQQRGSTYHAADS